MIKVFHIVTSFDIGGAERVAFNIAKSKSPNFEYHVVEVVHSDSQFSHLVIDELGREGVRLHFSPIRNKKLGILLFWLWFIHIYIKYRPNVIHSHTEIPDLALWLFRKIACLFFWIKTKYIRTIHNTQLWNEWGKIGSLVEPYYINHHSNYAISLSTRKCYEQQYGEKNVPIIYNGLEEIVQCPFKGIIPGKINVLFAGRFEYQKGIDELIAVIKALKDNCYYHFHIVGAGSMASKVHFELSDLPSVSIYDKIYGLSQYLSSFDYLFMPSNFEGLALMPIEASLSKTPTIINDCLGLVDTLPQNWPLKVCDNNVEQFIHIFKDVLPTVDRVTLGNQAYHFAKEKFGMTRMQLEYEKIYIGNEKEKSINNCRYSMLSCGGRHREYIL